MAGVSRQDIDTASMAMINMGTEGHNELVDYINFGVDDLLESSMLPPLPRMGVYITPRDPGTPIQRMVAYITPRDPDTPIQREFFAATGSTPRIAELIQEASMTEVLGLVPVPQEDVIAPFVSELGSILRELAITSENEDKPFQIIGILAVKKNLRSVLVTPRDFFNALVSLMPEEDEYEEPSEEELRDAHTLVSERATGVSPYERWKEAREEFEAQDPEEKRRKLAAGILVMVLLPKQETHPLIWQQVLGSPDA